MRSRRVAARLVIRHPIALARHQRRVRVAATRRNATTVPVVLMVERIAVKALALFCPDRKPRRHLGNGDIGVAVKHKLGDDLLHPRRARFRVRGNHNIIVAEL